MTDLTNIIRQLDKMSQNDLVTLLLAVSMRLDRIKKLRATLQKYRGVAKDVWETDAQQYVNDLR